jgi:hypothetical protein
MSDILQQFLPWNHKHSERKAVMVVGAGALHLYGYV